MNFTYDDFIDGNGFKSLADFEYLPNSVLPKKDCIVYCKTDHLKFLILELEKYENDNYNYILITHNSDGNIVRENPREFDLGLKTIPKNIKKWYAQNVFNVIDDRMCPIPIGLENSNWLQSEYKRNMLLEVIDKREIFNKCKLIYINLNVDNNQLDRTPIYRYYKNNEFVTVLNNKNGDDFVKFRNDLIRHKFSICAFGNGVDTIRVMESLLLKTIPIVRNVACFRHFKEKYDWPLFIVDDYNNLNYDDLNNFYENNKNKFNDYYKFTFNYFKDLITTK